MLISCHLTIASRLHTSELELIFSAFHQSFGMQIFQFIGDRCGGFICCSIRTEGGLNLTAARIKIRTNQNGFIPAQIFLPQHLAGSIFFVSIGGINAVTFRSSAAVNNHKTRVIHTEPLAANPKGLMAENQEMRIFQI